MELSEGVIVLKCLDCKRKCNWQFINVTPYQRVIGCNRHEDTQAFNTDSVISLESRFKFVDRKDIKEINPFKRHNNWIATRIDTIHPLAVCGLLSCFIIGMIAFANKSMLYAILATLTGLAFIIYIKKLEEDIEDD
jgi:hypothetical protein